jgi:hypothetical protein
MNIMVSWEPARAERLSRQTAAQLAAKLHKRVGRRRLLGERGYDSGDEALLIVEIAPRWSEFYGQGVWRGNLCGDAEARRSN